MTAIDFHKLAKTELHSHLDGSLSLETIRHLADLAQIELPEDDAELKHHVTAPATCESLLDYLEAFDYIRPLLQTKEALTVAAYDVAKQAALENVIYIKCVLLQQNQNQQSHYLQLHLLHQEYEPLFLI